MITREYDSQLLIVTQPHHAELAGLLAANWGNEGFHLLEPAVPMIIAAREHDNGWREWDNRPTVDPAAGQPWSFATLTYVEHAKLYWRGMLRAANDDPYEGLMVSMHGRGLYNQRYHTDLALKRVPKDRKEKMAVNRVVKDSERLQKNLRRRLVASSDYRRHASDTQIWRNYCLLQVFDRLALHVCWKGQTPYTIHPVPTDYEKGKEHTLNFEPTGDGGFKVSPYPFKERPFEPSVTGFLVPLQKYESDEQFREAYYRAKRIELKFRFM